MYYTDCASQFASYLNARKIDGVSRQLTLRTEISFVTFETFVYSDALIIVCLTYVKRDAERSHEYRVERRKENRKTITNVKRNGGKGGSG